MHKTFPFLLGTSQVWTPPKWWIGLSRGLLGLARDGLWFYRWAHYGKQPRAVGSAQISGPKLRTHVYSTPSIYALEMLPHTHDEIGWRCSPRALVSGAQSCVQAMTGQPIISFEDRHGRSGNQGNVIVLCPFLLPKLLATESQALF